MLDEVSSGLPWAESMALHTRCFIWSLEEAASSLQCANPWDERTSKGVPGALQTLPEGSFPCRSWHVARPVSTNSFESIEYAQQVTKREWLCDLQHVMFVVDHISSPLECKLPKARGLEIPLAYWYIIYLYKTSLAQNNACCIVGIQLILVEWMRDKANVLRDRFFLNN